MKNIFTKVATTSAALSLDQNSGSIQVTQVAVATPEPTTFLGLATLSALGIGSTLKKKKQVSC